MRTIVKGKNAEVPDRVREYAERKLKRIERLLDDQTDATVELWNEQHKSAADAHIAEVTLVIHGRVLRSRATGASYQEALDDVVDKVERQAVDHKEKPRLRARPEEEKQILRRLADGSEGPPRESRIVKTKRFAIEPMFEEDAVAAMEELGHQFFVFVNAETERVAILYRRDDGDYGLIEPVHGRRVHARVAAAPRARRSAHGRRSSATRLVATGDHRAVGSRPPPVVRCRECFPTADALAPTSRSATAWSRPSIAPTRSGPSAIQVFVDNPTAWRRRLLPPAELPAFRTRLDELDIAPIAVHASYLVNLAGPEEDLFGSLRRLSSRASCGPPRAIWRPVRQRPRRVASWRGRRRRDGAPGRRPRACPGRGR